MFFGDHDPPHFHARYAGHTAKYRFDGELLDGSLPRRANRLVREWAHLRSHELLVCWDRALRHEDPVAFNPWSNPWSMSHTLR
jgi:Domain of unknown function (DUF4160)